MEKFLDSGEPTAGVYGNPSTYAKALNNWYTNRQIW